MKKIMLLLGVCVGLSGCNTIKKIPESEKTFSKVVEIPGVEKDQIYQGAKGWIAENFNSAKSVIELSDKDSGRIIGNGIIPYPCISAMDCLGRGDWTVKFTMKLDSKDNKFRAAFSNIRIKFPPGGSFSNMESAMDDQAELDAIKPKLLSFADQVAAHIKQDKADSNW